MDVAGLLSSEPLASLDPAVRSFLAESLADASTVSETAELLAPFLADAELGDEKETLALCKRFAKAESAAATGGYAKRLSGKVAQLCEEPDLVEESWPETTPAPSAPSKTSAKGRSVALRKADRAALEKAAMASGARLELVEADSTSIAKAFRACVELRPWIEEDAERLDMLGASFLAYADEHCDEKLPRWARLLQDLLDEAGVSGSLDEDEDLSALATKAVTQLVKSGLLQAKKKTCEAGDPVWAFLPEDEDWHPAVVESILDDGRLKLIFIEYGKPQEAGPDEVRAMEDVADEGEEGEGEPSVSET
ncbi:unnamed protein product [Durusdinium trenchii]|uniref:Tudor domain-containing protein n=1 Tax=Durusdinium trenchii TaxID=1381693 RepID=A0ABP0QEP0_9DINO